MAPGGFIYLLTGTTTSTMLFFNTSRMFRPKVLREISGIDEAIGSILANRPSGNYNKAFNRKEWNSRKVQRSNRVCILTEQNNKPFFSACGRSVTLLTTPLIEDVMNYISMHYEIIAVDDGHYVCLLAHFRTKNNNNNYSTTT